MNNMCNPDAQPHLVCVNGSHVSKETHVQTFAIVDVIECGPVVKAGMRYILDIKRKRRVDADGTETHAADVNNLLSIMHFLLGLTECEVTLHPNLILHTKMTTGKTGYLSKKIFSLFPFALTLCCTYLA